VSGLVGRLAVVGVVRSESLDLLKTRSTRRGDR
jgi:hypothetical protein